MKLILTLVLMLHASLVFTQDKVAVVKLLKGNVDVIVGGKTEKLAMDQWVVSGAVVKTAEKSVVKLVFIDKSQVNIGPNSEMKIEKFGGGDSGVLDLVKGKIRSQVSKDYLQQQNKDQSKMFVKTPNAIMGIRGTDFELAVAPPISEGGTGATSAVLYEGAVGFAQYDQSSVGTPTTASLEQMVDAGVNIQPGQFSVVNATDNIPSIPVNLSVHQLEKMEATHMGAETPASSDKPDTSAHSPVPAGLDSSVVASAPAAVDAVINADAGGATPNIETMAANAMGSIAENGAIQPVAGTVLHIDTGTMIAPPAESTFDPVSQTFVAPPSAIAFSDSGEAVIAGGTITVTPSGNFAVTVANDDSAKGADKAGPVNSSGEAKPAAEPKVVIVAPPSAAKMGNFAAVVETAKVVVKEEARIAAKEGGDNNRKPASEGGNKPASGGADAPKTAGPEAPHAPVVAQPTAPPPPDLPPPPPPQMFPPVVAQPENATNTLLHVNIN